MSEKKEQKNTSDSKKTHNSGLHPDGSHRVPQQPNNPLHGVKLADILEYLTANYTWAGLGMRIDIRCFTHDPSIKSSLKFLRRHQWARDKVEQLYLESKSEDQKLGL